MTTAVGAGCILTSTTNTDANAGFCKCDIATGYVQTHTAYAVGTDPVYVGTGDLGTASAACLPAAYKPGYDEASTGHLTLRDECWGTGATAYADDTALKAAVAGCIKSSTTGFAVCDTANGWVSPFVSGTDAVTNAWAGKCVPACYIFGKQTTGAGTTPGTDADACWHASTSLTYAQVFSGAGNTIDLAAADATLSTLSGALDVQSCGAVSLALGFCECKAPWIKNPTDNGACISPCHQFGA